METARLCLGCEASHEAAECDRCGSSDYIEYQDGRPLPPRYLAERRPADFKSACWQYVANGRGHVQH